jgi:hypothetical protein
MSMEIIVVGANSILSKGPSQLFNRLEYKSVIRN